MSVKAKVSATYFVDNRVIARVKAKLASEAKKIKQHDVKVGIHEADGGKPIIKYTGEEGAETLGYVALAHEFGAGVPMRSWFRGWFDANIERCRKEMSAAMQAERKGNTQAVALLSMKWAYEMRARIATNSGGLAPLAESTRRQRTNAGLAEGPPLMAIGQIVEAIKPMVDGLMVSL